MSEHVISLPENVYGALLAAAQKDGVTPVDWIAAKLPVEEEATFSLPAMVSDLVGAINSREEPHHSYEKTALGEIIAAKLARQGLHRP
ncbi:MAG: hypothetical protein ACRDEA_03105 [Microcystaceae cyanobacterium]